MEGSQERLTGFRGTFQCLATAYSSDVVSLKLRPILCTWGNACWVIGQLVASSVLRVMLDRSDQWAYRYGFVPYPIDGFY